MVQTQAPALSKEAIAALEVIANPRVAFRHRLDLKNVSLQWIFRRRSRPPSSTESSPQRERSSWQEHSPDLTPIKPQQHTVEDANVEDMPSKRAPLTGMRTLLSLDTSAPVTNSDILIDSPRSAYVILSRGHRVAELCPVDNQELYNAALIEGTSRDMVELRIIAENKRRAGRYNALVANYQELCKAVSSSEVVQAILNYAEGLRLEDEANLKRMETIPRYSYTPLRDSRLFDQDCEQVIVEARCKTLEEIKRKLDQNARNVLQQVERERRFAKEKESLQELKRQQEQRDRERRERSIEIQKRGDEFHAKVAAIHQQQAAEVEAKRAALDQRESDLQKRREILQQKRESALADAAARRAERRRSVKEQLSLADEERRVALQERSSLLSRMHERDIQRRQETKRAELRELRDIGALKGRAARQLAEIRMEEKRLKLEGKLERISLRAEELQHSKALRLAAKRSHLHERHEYSELARKTAEHLRAEHLEQLTQHYAHKQQQIEEANEERRRQQVLLEEMGRQSRAMQLEERRRSALEKEFSTIGYMNNTLAKSKWLERESEKRSKLACQIRQEREALDRAKEEIIRRIEQGEVERRKEDSAFSK